MSGRGPITAIIAIAVLGGCAAQGGPVTTAAPHTRPPANTAAHRCDRVAEPAARTPRAGNESTVQRLVRALRPGQTGCLRRGTYVGDVAVSRSRIVLRAYPGERARIVGRLWFRRAAHDDVVQGLRLDGSSTALPSPTVNGDRIRFTGVDVTNRHTGICFLLGSARYGRAEGTVIERSRIHDCGRLPSTNEDHGIYVAAADDTRIVGNVVYRNTDRGIQLYPDAQRTLIAHNVITQNGEGIIFSGDEGRASSGNTVRNNVISNSRIRADVESWYPPGNPVGVGNIVRDNCIFGGRSGTISAASGGFVAAGNVVADPRYADPAGADFSVGAASPCAGLLLGTETLGQSRP